MALETNHQRRLAFGVGSVGSDIFLKINDKLLFIMKLISTTFSAGFVPERQYGTGSR
jgi:hypothetical protein